MTPSALRVNRTLCFRLWRKSSYLYNGDTYTEKMAFLYLYFGICMHYSCRPITNHSVIIIHTLWLCICQDWLSIKAQPACVFDVNHITRTSWQTRECTHCEIRATVDECCYIEYLSRPSYRLNRTFTLQWRHNDHDCASDHQRLDCLLNVLFRRRSKRTSKLRVTGLCEGNSPVTGELTELRASDAKNVSIWSLLIVVIFGFYICAFREMMAY